MVAFHGFCIVALLFLSYTFVTIHGSFLDSLGSQLSSSTSSGLAVSPSLVVHTAEKRAIFRRYGPISSNTVRMNSNVDDPVEVGIVPLKFDRNSRDKIFQSLRLHPFLRFMAEEGIALKKAEAEAAARSAQQSASLDLIEAPEFLG